MKRLLLVWMLILSPSVFLLSPLCAYTNPILPFDFSNPDVIRLGKYYYMTYSSYASTPGLPILRSEDGVHWNYADAALKDTIPGYGHLDACPAGRGVCSPSIRFYEGRFYIYYSDPDIGIFCIRSAAKTESIPCVWEPAVLVKAGKGLIDPCPVWDAKGRCFLVHAFEGSRAGFQSALAVCHLSSDGLSVVRGDELVFDGHPENPAIESPKWYRRNNYYYIFCQVGGEKNGWQVCLRSKSPYGPYEVKRVLEQDTTDIDGPYRGAWVEHWFYHSQDVGTAGRIIHLQPLKWYHNWPVIGDEGRPVMSAKDEGAPFKGIGIETVHDEFDHRFIAPGWQWSGNRNVRYYYLNPDSSRLRLFTYPADDVQSAPNLLLRKIPANTSFTFEVRLRFTPNPENKDHEQAGILVHGRKSRMLPVPANGKWYYMRVVINRTHECHFYISRDGHSWELVDDQFYAVAGEGVGARIGFYATRDRKPINDAGYLDIDWVTITPNH